MLNLARRETSIKSDPSRWRRERRSALLRVVALIILVINLIAAKDSVEGFVHVNIIAVYGLATLGALGVATAMLGPRWIGAVFVTVDAFLVIVLFHAHLFAGGSGGVDHQLTAPSLAVGFLLLTHVALRLEARLVIWFSFLVIVGWLALLALAVADGANADHSWRGFGVEAALAAAFTFAAFVCWQLTSDHDTFLKAAIASERRRRNLARFFSPNLLSELEATHETVRLNRRDAAIMFVDLRSFTRYSEDAAPEEVATLLAEYRELVTSAVFRHGGTIDKFMGDGVMAVFGLPRMGPDDAERALKCGLELRYVLGAWGIDRRKEGRPALEAAIGLHYGKVVGGILESGSHDEFTILGDAVNVAQRLERLCRPLCATVVASEEILVRAAQTAGRIQWAWREEVELDGRNSKLRVGYLREVEPAKLCSRPDFNAADGERT